MENTIDNWQEAYVDNLMNPPKDYVMDQEFKKKLIKIGIDAKGMERRIRINIINRFVSRETARRESKELMDRFPELYGDNKREIKYDFRKAS